MKENVFKSVDYLNKTTHNTKKDNLSLLSLAMLVVHWWTAPLR